MMRVVLADTVVELDGWTDDMDQLGEYTLAVRKTPEELREERERRSRYTKKFKVKPVRYEEHTVVERRGDIGYFLPGLWPRVKEYLEQKGVDYVLEDKRDPSIRPKPDYSRISGTSLRYGQDITLALVALADCGIIKCTTAYGKSFLISLICKIFPTLNILVTTSSAQVVGTLYSYLCKENPGEVGYIYGRGNTSHGKRIVVSTLKSLCNISPEKVQLLLCDECHSIGHNEYGKAVQRFMFCRRFGFSASPVRNDGSNRVLESIFGPVIQEVDYQEAVKHDMVARIKYHMIPVHDASNIIKSNKELPEFMLKRLSYWANYYRNVAIAEFVYRLKKVYDGQILIMVESLEHAIRLHRLLPFFKVAHGGANDIAALQGKLKDVPLDQYKLTAKQLDIMRKAYEKGTLRYVIATMTWRQGVNFKQLAVLIRADGSVSEVNGIQIPGRVARISDGKECAYVIDCDDRFSDWSKRRARQRRELYGKQGWPEASEQEVLDDLGGSTDQ